MGVFTWGLLCQKQVTRAWISNYIPQILLDMITYVCLRYPLLAHKSAYIEMWHGLLKLTLTKDMISWSISRLLMIYVRITLNHDLINAPLKYNAFNRLTHLNIFNVITKLFGGNMNTRGILYFRWKYHGLFDFVMNTSYSVVGSINTLCHEEYLSIYGLPHNALPTLEFTAVWSASFFNT